MIRNLWPGWLTLIVMGCAAGGAPASAVHSKEPSTVVGAVWQWTATDTPAGTLAVSAPERYTLQLGDDGKARIVFDCNRGGGDYQIGSGTLAFGPLLSTRMACPPDTLDARFMQGLTEASTFFVENNRLSLGLRNGGAMLFRPAQ